MTRSFQVGLCLVLLLGIALAGFSLAGSDEPRLEGRSLTHWLKQLDSQPEMLPEVKKALSQSGQTVLPCLVGWIHKKDTPFRQKAVEILQAQSVLRLDWMTAEQHRQMAVTGFLVLKDTARPAIPALARALNDGEIASSVANALSVIGPEGLCALTNGLANPDKRVRMAVLQALVFKAREPVVKAFVPLMLAMLQDEEADVRANAAEVLGIAGEQPELVIPALIRLLDDPAACSRCAAAEALGRFGPQSKAALPKLKACCQVATIKRERDETTRAIARVEGRDVNRGRFLLASVRNAAGPQ